MKQPTLSVTMTNYNHGKYLPKALQSILTQSYLPIEVIIIDDGSTDNSVSIIEEFKKQYPTIRLIRNEKNMGREGILHNANRLLYLALGDYIYPMSCDDELLPDFFEKAMQMAQLHPEAGMIFGKVLYVNEEGRILQQKHDFVWGQSMFISPDVFLKELLEVEGVQGVEKKNTLTPSCIFKRQTLMEINGFFPELGYFSDNFVMRTIGLKYGVCFISDYCLNFRVTPESFSQSGLDKPKAMLDIGARAVWLMKSADLKDRFPADYVQKWKKMYRDWVIKTSVIRFSRKFDHALDYLKNNYDFNDWSHRAVGFCFLSSMKVCIYLLMLWVKITLMGYSGDVSEYRPKQIL